jgi:hypothetical protein
MVDSPARRNSASGSEGEALDIARLDSSRVERVLLVAFRLSSLRCRQEPELDDLDA